jgi:UDP-glucuronate decarboxylase
VKIKIVRIFNTYGPRMHPNDGRVVSNFIMQALRGKAITLYGDGSQTRAFCFVDDLVEGFLRMMASGGDITGPINLGNPHEISIATLAERIITLTGSTSRIICQPVPQDDPVQRCPNIDRARSLLDWQPTVSLDEGLRRTIAYFEDLLIARGQDVERAAVAPHAGGY